MIRQKGSILVLILWVLIILSLLSIAISYRASGDIKLAKYEADNIKSLYLAKAGIAKMIAELSKDINDYDSLNEDWAKEKEFAFRGGSCLYSASDEDARFNLNSSDLSGYREYLTRLGLDSDLSQKLLDYRIKKGEKGFEFMEELFLTDGMTRDIYSNIKDNVTIYKGIEPKVNINTADENVLRAVVANDLIINKIIEFRNGNDNKPGTEDDGIFTEADFSIIFSGFGLTPEDILNYQGLFKPKSDFFRITVNASFSEDRKIIKSVIAVVNRSGKIYYWKEE